MNAERNVISAMPAPRPASAVPIGKAHRDDRAEREQEDHHRDEQPDAFRAGRWLALGGLRDSPPNSTWMPASRAGPTASFSWV